MSTLQLLVATSPVLLVLIFLVILRLPAVKAMPLSLILHALLAYFIWKMPFSQISAATLEGFIIAASVLWIIFGAILLLNLLKASGAIHVIRDGFTRISADRRVQVIIIAWLFGGFLEGAAGFGSPAAITAPLLVALGFPPLAAVTLALISNSMPVSYGSVGTTFLIGTTQGLQQGPSIAPIVADYLGTTPLTTLVEKISFQTAVINIVPGTLVPLVLVLMLTRFFGENKSWREGLAVWKFALLAGFSFTGFSALIAAFLGPEFPSLLGGLFSLALMIFIAQKGWLLPKETWDFSKEPQMIANETPEITDMPLWKAWSPYLIATTFLVITRLRFLPFKNWLNDIQVGWQQILGTDISTSFAPLYSPGAIFVLTVIISAFILKVNSKRVGFALKTASLSLVSSVIALGTAVPLVRIFINSGVNQLGIESMPLELAETMAMAFGSIWPLVAPYVGSLGAFISGSATFSNLMFSLFQFGVALQNNLSPVTICALQTMGAAVGNMICVVNVVAASSVVGLQGKEGKIIRFTAIPSLMIALIGGVVALVVFV